MSLTSVYLLFPGRPAVNINRSHRLRPFTLAGAGAKVWGGETYYGRYYLFKTQLCSLSLQWISNGAAATKSESPHKLQRRGLTTYSECLLLRTSCCVMWATVSVATGPAAAVGRFSERHVNIYQSTEDEYLNKIQREHEATVIFKSSTGGK